MVRSKMGLYLIYGVVPALLITSCIKEEDETILTTKEVKAEIFINPAHGLPGHRCDVPVGNPIESKSVESEEIGPNTVFPIQITNPPKINPPHGEAGHDCAIPVGSPLG